MTAPRQLRRGATYLVTRNCVFGEHRLAPSPIVNQTFGYVLARAAEACGIAVHAFCVMSSHYHLVVTDPEAKLPRFHQRLDSEVARALNALRGTTEYFWCPGSFNAVLLASPEDILAKCVYVLANPVAAGLVKWAQQWPGLASSPGELGEVGGFERPGHFFDPDGLTTARALLRITPPPGLGSPEEARAKLAQALLEREKELHRTRTSFVGRARILKERFSEKARVRRPIGGLRPRFAAKDPGLRSELARRLKTFLEEYREALAKWRCGLREVVFPEGTYQMRVEHLVICAGAG